LTLKFVYLNLQEHPRGNYMLERLIGAGLLPVAIVEERSSLAEKGRASLTKELACLTPDVPLPRPLAEIVADYPIRCEEVANHNDAHCVSILEEIQPELIVLGDTRIIKPPIINLPPFGVVNVHPGYLPLVRGNNPYVWAILHNLPQGVSVHFIDEEIDTGPVLVRRELEMADGISYPQLLNEINVLCGDLLIEAMHCILEGQVGVPQGSFLEAREAMPTFLAATEQVKVAALLKLQQRQKLAKDRS
jgi:methionyl-tRNA formyltransferase